MGRFYIENFGCRATQADGAALENQFLEKGMERAPAAGDAEIVVLNTCTVTEGADKDARALIRRLRRENPACQILVTGCYAQRAPEELAAIPGVTWVVGNSHKHLAAEIAVSRDPTSVAGFVPLSQLSPANRADVIVGDIFAHTELMAAPVFDSANERTRPNLKVQDGCDNRCSFCVIPSVRGHSRSLPPERVIAEVRTLAAAGYREVVISGINLGRWGRDLESSSQLLVDLVKAILEHTSLEKLRISSVEPMDWSDELIGVMASSNRIAKHAHVPLQSASDTVLRRMHRKYRPWHYSEKIAKIRARMPNAAIGADVMVGFPGETEAEFAETRRMIEDLPFTYLHVFTYSSRPGTPAAAQRDQVPVRAARQRNRILREIAAQKKAAFQQAQIGKIVQAITLRSGDGEFTEALTDNYLKLKISGPQVANRWVPVLVEGREGDFLLGRVEGTETGPVTHSEVTLPNTQKSNNLIDLQPFAG
ncbi:MAG TPA: tRNA (N(6)-L-threonylcarbamoyladenosine(37)-C(2))-methylthiotransferase MtaB [Terriglobales bacterium]|nr:tRNA (N(6)-L-threonylcarbamoyladenosine(37)-C(2))-methylthiotransferase MtaB [Terriglobales bacterium]